MSNFLREQAVKQGNFGNKPRSEYSDEYYTPDTIVQALGPFDLDPSAGPKSHAAVNIRRPDDGLAVPWSGRVWLNPPYSNIHEWLEKFVRHGDGVTLVNARPDTQWFQRLVRGASAVHWLSGRVPFSRPEGMKKQTPVVGSVLVAYGEKNAESLRKSGLPGITMTVDNDDYHPNLDGPAEPIGLAMEY